MILQLYPVLFSSSARKQEIIKMTEQVIVSITSGDYEAYT